MSENVNNNMSPFKRILPWLLAMFAVVVDIVTKWAVVHHNTAKSIANGSDPTSRYSWLTRNPVELVGEWLRVILVYNDSGIFGMNFGLPDEYRQLILIVTSLLAVGVIILFYNWIKPEKLFPRAMLGLIIGGAFGNLADRIFGHIIYRGEWKLFFEQGVVDWIDAAIPKGVFGVADRTPFYTFNMADSFVTVSIILLLLYIIFTKDSDIFREKKKNNHTNTNKEDIQETA